MALNQITGAVPAEDAASSSSDGVGSQMVSALWRTCLQILWDVSYCKCIKIDYD